MLIDCPACGRSYHVSRAEIGQGGRTVICPRCEATWFVDGDGTSVALPAPDELRVPSFSARPSPEADAPRERRSLARSFWRSARPVLAGAACLALAMGVIGQRERIVRLAPRLAGLYAAAGLPVNVRGLEIAALAPMRAENADLTVSGTLRNVAQSRVVVPRLSYEVRDTAGATLLTWTETAPQRTLATGRTLPFVSKPHAMPPGAGSIIVRFEDGEAAGPVRLARRD